MTSFSLLPGEAKNGQPRKLFPAGKHVRTDGRRTFSLIHLRRFRTQIKITQIFHYGG